MLQFGIDLGGTKTEIIALDSEGNERLRRRAPTPRESYPDILNTILTLVTDAASELNEPYTLGLGIPGALSYKTGLVKNANTTCLIGQDLKGDIERSLKHPVVIANDADRWFTDLDLPAGTTYTYEIRALAADGTPGELSDPITLSTLP